MQWHKLSILIDRLSAEQEEFKYTPMCLHFVHVSYCMHYSKGILPSESYCITR